MDRIRIRGGNRLNGTIPISGAKNATLPLMIASLLTPETLTLGNVPRLADVQMLLRILRNHGTDLRVDGKRAGEDSRRGETIHLTSGTIVDTEAPYELVSRMRASFWVLGPLVARCGQARVSLPGGCAIGTRPVDLHLFALEQLGATIELDSGNVIAAARHGLRGNRIAFPKVSVGATHSALMAAALARGETVIENAAREPEVGDLAICLGKMGAKIHGIGSSTLMIEGVDRLTGAVHHVIPDRIETGTYAAAAVLMMSAEKAEALGLKPRARIVDSCLVGSDPTLMLTGPIDATQRLFGRTGLTMDDMDVTEINEAFASVVLAWAQEMQPDMAKVNPNGGAIALGHALGSTGAVLLTKALHELERTDGEHAPRHDVLRRRARHRHHHPAGLSATMADRPVGSRPIPRSPSRSSAPSATGSARRSSRSPPSTSTRTSSRRRWSSR